MFLYNWREQLIYGASAIITQLINSGRNPKKFSIENILFVKDDEIGDLCYSIPVFAMIRTNDGTGYIKSCVPAAGSFTINLGAAATGEISIGFLVVN